MDKNENQAVETTQVTSESNLSTQNQSQKPVDVVVGDFLKKAVRVSKRVATSVSETATRTSQQVKEDSLRRRKEKYCPITMRDYRSKSFCIPNVIRIIDDATERDKDVAKGAIGHLVKENNVEIFYLFDEYIKATGLQFVPAAMCDSIYHVDHFDRNRFICVDEIFNQTLEEKIAELEHIAYCLGAKMCSIEIVDNDSSTNGRIVSNDTTVTPNEIQKNHANPSTSAIAHINATVTSSQNRTSTRSGISVTTFDGNETLKRPTLKWFEHNGNIQNLIEMRLTPGSGIVSKKLVLNHTGAVTMSRTTAIAIDSTIKSMNGKNQANVEQNVQKEKNSQVIFSVQF